MHRLVIALVVAAGVVSFSAGPAGAQGTAHEASVLGANLKVAASGIRFTVER